MNTRIICHKYFISKAKAQINDCYTSLPSIYGRYIYIYNYEHKHSGPYICGWPSRHNSIKCIYMQTYIHTYVLLDGTNSICYGSYRVELREAGITYLNKLGKFLSPHELECVDAKGQKQVIHTYIHTTVSYIVAEP